MSWNQQGEDDEIKAPSPKARTLAEYIEILGIKPDTFAYTCKLPEPVIQHALDGKEITARQANTIITVLKREFHESIKPEHVTGLNIS
jgi:hypothetical protein